MELLFPIARNGDEGSVIGSVRVAFDSERQTPLDMSVTGVSLAGVTEEFGILVYQDDEWIASFISAEPVYEWRKAHGMWMDNGYLHYGRRYESSLLVDAVASLFPVDHLPIGVTFPGMATVWSREGES